MRYEKEEIVQLKNQQTFSKSYKVISLEKIEKLKPVISNIKKVKPIEQDEFTKDLSFLNSIENLNTDEISQYINETGYSSYSFKFNNVEEGAINFENLQLLETIDGGYIAYVLAYEPNPDWYYNNLNSDGTLNLDISTYEGEITKYSLEREVIWTTKNTGEAQAKVGGDYETVCTYSFPYCNEGNHDNERGWDNCAYSDGSIGETCRTVYVGGSGDGDPENDDNSGDSNGGGGTNNDDEPCNNVEGTPIIDDQPLSGTDGGCAPNNNNGASNNNTSMSGIIANLQVVLRLNNSQTLWLEEHTDKAWNIHLFLKNDDSQKAIDFAKVAVEALIDDGEVDFDDRIINLLTEEAKCVYEKLKNQNGNLFKTTIGRFIDNPDYHLQLNSGGTCNTGDDACTDGSSIDSGLVIINIINEGNGTLDLAALILHEGIHAEIYKYVNEYNQGLDPQNRANLLGYYFLYKNINIGTAQHQHMADKFVKPIAEALRALDNNNYPLEDYMGFAWDGLRKYGWDGYYNNGEYVTLDRNAYSSVNQNVLNNTEFNNDCN